jgi:hypothetical protein
MTGSLPPHGGQHGTGPAHDGSRGAAVGQNRARAVAMCALVVVLAGCTPNSSQVPEAQYPTKIIGGWLGTVGNLRESMVIKGDGTFVCHLQKTGFIAQMLYPAPPGTVSGTWSIVGAVLTLTISAAKHERLENRKSSSVIVAFHENEVELKSHGNTSSFQRTAGL